MIPSLLVANRGEIARRIIRTARRLGVRTIAVHSDVDADLPYVAEADVAVALGSPRDFGSIDALLAVALGTGAAAVHPGCGFRSEDAEFARRCAAAGLVWVGPPPEAMELLADKVAARQHVAAAGVPVLPGTSGLASVDEAVEAGARLGPPLVVKAVSGGGGIGMGVAHDAGSLRRAARTALSRGGAFGDARILLERYLPRARHVEVQVVGMPDGTVRTFGERDCSVQRRHQKVVEECPSPAVDAALRARLCAAAARAVGSVGYRGAGTVEFLLDPATGEFHFLEVNARLQVEHPITEQVHGVDLVELQLRIASGEEVPDDVPAPRGHAVELRVCAEDPQRFLPRPGRITEWVEPAGVRVDAGYAAGTVVSPHFDPLLAKVVAHGADRAEALARARRAAAEFVVRGPQCNLPFLRELLDSPEFTSGDYDTGVVERITARRGKES
ncbi:biotin carboxylase N-terminal domain-containing protein [Saccharopolyspora hordei]|uniref:biotin carboxylase n=1 Tax=Saccharopolyspora hordei TaxID=1838 RepID=A0A853ASK6_9PSEU|nr:acetyl-CoA carboxylase biotin carboxylase subunit [Saccharopolyspora hordei]